MAKTERTKQTKQPKTRGRHSIGEWYGIGFETMSSSERFRQAKVECRRDGLSGELCPFQTRKKCSKKGGVCTLRLYEQVGEGPVCGTGPLITTCPQRFLEDETIFRWVAKELLQTEAPVVLSEIGFLDKLRTESDPHDNRDFIGRIDNVLVHPSKAPLDWCALEIQAVYFSGKSMPNEFRMLAKAELPAIPFPAAHRRPDWRSSGPKRLLPQLQTKVPTIRTWGKKMAVVIDEKFFGELVGLEREKHQSNAEIAWFVVAYKPAQRGWRLVPRDVVYTKLDASVKSLTGGTPLSREQFEGQLQEKLKSSVPICPRAGKAD